MLLIAAVVLLSLGGSAVPARAENGDGTGPSDGTAGAKPLKFVSAKLLDAGTSIINAADIPLKPKIKLLFDKNIVNSTVWGINRECFTLLSPDKTPVPIEVTKIDDTVNFDERQAVFIEPVDTLKPKTAYTLKVKPELKAKNGVSTLGGTTSGRGVTIVFTTKEAVPNESSSAAPKQAAAPAPESENRTGTAAGDRKQETVSALPSPGVPAVNQASDLPAASEAPVQTGTAANAAGAEAAAAPGEQTGQGASEQKPAQTMPVPEVPVSKADPGTASGQESSAAAEASFTSGGSDPHWTLMMIVGGVLVMGWLTVEILYFRRKRRMPEQAADKKA